MSTGVAVLLVIVVLVLIGIAAATMIRAIRAVSIATTVQGTPKARAA